jgi:predicted XRE-type DNA-binding protein
MEKLKILISLIEIATINKATIVEAINSEFKDFEDALQNFAAQNDQEIQVIVTRNVKDFKKSRLPVMNPETYLRSINMR